jgi:hypothetical protein
MPVDPPAMVPFSIVCFDLLRIEYCTGPLWEELTRTDFLASAQSRRGGDPRVPRSMHDRWVTRILQRIRGRSTAAPSAPGPDNGRRRAPAPPTAAQKREAAAWLEALEAGRLTPPRDIHDAQAWDTYWKNQLEVGAVDQGFNEMMSSDPTLAAMLAMRGVRTILCAGNGLSTEALALALHGFDVTALDISTVPGDLMLGALQNPEHPLRRLSRIAVGADRTIAFEGSGPIDPQACPAIHQNPEYPPRAGGRLRFSTGDLTNATVCPGPFDVVIERRTVQLFPDAERVPAIERLVARLANPGMFVSHQHCGGWRPGDPRTHYADAWMATQGFARHVRSTADTGTLGRNLAYLVFTTG